MLTHELAFELPAGLHATMPPEARGMGRDGVRLLVTDREDGRVGHTRFWDLKSRLRPGDLLVVNDSMTIPASIPVALDHGDRGEEFRLHLSTNLGEGWWIVEPRTREGGPLRGGLRAGDAFFAGGVEKAVTLVERYKSFERLWLARAGTDLTGLAWRIGEPIRYPYVEGRWPIAAYQTVFTRAPGSAEMPSAGRPFSRRLIRELRKRGVGIASITLHTGVSSHEIAADRVEDHPMYPEWYAVPEETLAAIKKARAKGRRVIAVGTTVVRALETAVQGQRSGFTEIFIDARHRLRAVDGLITGLHAPVTSHLAMLSAFMEIDRLLEAYRDAVERGYLWHEFGDAHLIL